jgi:L-fucose isomerase-like protein
MKKYAIYVVNSSKVNNSGVERKLYAVARNESYVMKLRNEAYVSTYGTSSWVSCDYWN